MKQIELIDKVFKEQTILLHNEIQTLQFNENFSFELGNSFDNSLFNFLPLMGVYLIEIKIDNSELSIQDWISTFKSKWEHTDFINRFVPNTRIGRIRKHQEMTEWLPLYIGKSRNIQSRLKEHIYKKMEVNSGGLKLIERKNIYGEVFRISSIEINVNNYDLIIPQIERYFREKYNPILGKQ